MILPPIDYLMLRLVRHFLPEGAARFLLRHNWLIHPGLETRAPQEAAQRYLDTLAQHGVSVGGRRVMVFGYGGSYALGCLLLQAGASHVVLSEKEHRPDRKRNAALLAQFPHYLLGSAGNVQPNPNCLTLVHGDIRAAPGRLAPVDVVLSNSVYEHLEDVPGITQALARLTTPQGAGLHFIDLRDHYFKYPFEMYCYDEATWRRWLNPTSNHNRFRLGDYRRAFSASFARVSLDVLGRDPLALERARPRLRPEFLTNDPQEDSVTLAAAWVTGPK